MTTTVAPNLDIKKRADIDMDVLAKMDRQPWAMMEARYPGKEKGPPAGRDTTLAAYVE